MGGARHWLSGAFFGDGDGGSGGRAPTIHAACKGQAGSLHAQVGLKLAGIGDPPSRSQTRVPATSLRWGDSESDPGIGGCPARGSRLPGRKVQSECRRLPRASIFKLQSLSVFGQRIQVGKGDFPCRACPVGRVGSSWAVLAGRCWRTPRADAGRRRRAWAARRRGPRISRPLGRLETRPARSPAIFSARRGDADFGGHRPGPSRLQGRAG